jgi:hypothetical protein
VGGFCSSESKHERSVPRPELVVLKEITETEATNPKTVMGSCTCEGGYI